METRINLAAAFPEVSLKQVSENNDGSASNSYVKKGTLASEGKCSGLIE